MGLARPFAYRAVYSPPPGYRLLPFRFGELDLGRYIATNDVGEMVVLSRADVRALVGRRLEPSSTLYRELKAKHFLFDDDARVALDLLALKGRTRAEPIARLTALHIFVVTLRCDHACHYCQVSRQNEDRAAFDMSWEHAERALQIAFASPNPDLKLEFQGGEPLLNFALIRRIVDRALELNVAAGKNLGFVIASNLSRVTDEMLAYCRDHGIVFSTSLDGPGDLHDQNRPLPGRSSHAATMEGIARVRASLGHDGVAALMTTTEASLPRVEEIVDEYVRCGFDAIFLRSLSPYGFAAKKGLLRSYSVERWLQFYRRGFEHILEINRRGHSFREEFAVVLLQKMFDPQGTGYVDLQSPAGMGIGALVYNYDGLVYASDEARMLAAMGDDSFVLGSLSDATFGSLMGSDLLGEVLDTTLLESAPMCSDCPFLPFCGADPAFHKATAGDVLGHKAFSAFCEKQMGVLRYLIGLLHDPASDAGSIMRGWLRS